MISSPSDNIRRTITQADFLSLDRSHWMMTDLVGWWPLQEGAGLTAFDMSPNRNNGTLTSMDQSTDWVVGSRGGKALDFDGTSDRVAVSHSPSIDFERTDPFSVSFWLNRSRSDTFEVIIGKASSTPKGWYVNFPASADNDEINVFLRNSAGNQIKVTGSTSLSSTSNWYHVVVTYDGSSNASGVSIYVDGAADSPSTVEDTLTSSITVGNGLQISGRAGANWEFQGKLFDVRLWGRELQPEEIQPLYLNPWAPIRSQALIMEVSAGPTQQLSPSFKMFL